MRAVVQRVSRAQVTVSGEIAGEIGLGLLVLLGVGRDDTEADATYLAGKIVGLRVFEDGEGKLFADLHGGRVSVNYSVRLMERKTQTKEF